MKDSSKGAGPTSPDGRSADTSKRYPGFTHHALPGGASVWSGIVAHRLSDPALFKPIWALHPADFHTIRSPAGKLVKTPRWQQAYGRDYRYSGSSNNAVPMPALLKPFLAWAQTLEPRLNSLLLNWYDADLGHYIGKHRDDQRDLIADAPIVTISLGSERIFRMRPYRKSGRYDIPVTNGSAIILAATTNLRWTHEVPAQKRFPGKRISITLRAFRNRAP